MSPLRFLQNTTLPAPIIATLITPDSRYVPRPHPPRPRIVFARPRPASRTAAGPCNLCILLDRQMPSAPQCAAQDGVFPEERTPRENSPFTFWKFHARRRRRLRFADPLAARSQKTPSTIRNTHPPLIRCPVAFAAHM